MDNWSSGLRTHNTGVLFLCFKTTSYTDYFFIIIIINRRTEAKDKAYTLAPPSVTSMQMH